MNVLSRYALRALVALLSGIVTVPSQAGNAAEVWNRRYDAMVSGSTATLDGADNVIVVVSVSAGNHFHIHAVKYAAATGATLWEKTITAPGAMDTVGVGVVADAAGNALIGGWANVSGASAFYTFKLAADDGALLWDTLNSGAAHVNERAWTVAVDPAGNPIVAGNSSSAAGDLDGYVIKYAAADGTVLWEHRFDGATHQADQIYSVSVDSAGNVAVTGSSFSGPQSDVYVGRYAAADGKSIWDKLYAAPTGGDDVGLSVATDAAGNVAIAAQIELAINDGPVGAYTAKYAAADGALLWENSLIIPGADTGPTALAADAAGNVFMTGFTTLTGHIDIDYYTAKYAGADGGILWERTYDGTGQAHDQAFDIALDAVGNAIVIGESDNAASPGHPDFQTIKYASDDGALLWQRRFNGPDESDDRLGLTLGRGKVLASNDGGAVITGLSSKPLAQAAVTIKYVPDDITQAPLLTAPASGSFNKSPVTIAYTLPETALPGSVKLVFDDTLQPRTLVVAASGESAGTHTFTVDPANPLQGGAFASGPALPDRYYSVTLSYQDIAGNEASSDTSMGVTIDTVAPDISLPTNTAVHTANPNGAALAFQITTNDLFDSTPAIVASPPSGSVFPVGVSQVSVTATDDSGNVSTTGFPVTVILVTDVPKPVSTILAVKNGSVPTTPGSGIPTGSKWVTFSVPSIHNGGAFVGFSATIRTPEANVTGVFDGPADAPVLLVKKGDPVPTNEAGQPLSGVTLVGYKEPIFPSTGEETATTLLAKLAGSDVSTANDSAILSGTSGSALQMIAREGSPAPNTLNGGNTAPVGTFQSFTSVAMPGNSGTIWFTATLAHSGGITSANDTGIWVSSPSSGLRLLIREGSDIPGIRTQPVKSIRALEPVIGSPGHGRYADNFVGVQVSLDDGTDSVFNIDVNGGIENDLSTGQPLKAGGPVPTKFGIPNWRQTGPVPAVVLATLGGPGVTAVSNRAILENSSIIARKGSATALPDGSVFKAFKDPVTALDQDGFPVDAFPATLIGGTTTATNDTGLWWWHGAAPALSVLAREGGFAPGGGRWRSFNSLTTIEGRGPVFTATLAVDGSANTSENDDGVWAINSAGALRPLFREGDVIAGRTLSSFNVLGVVNGSPGQRRAWTESADPTLVWRAFFTDGTSAIVKTTVP